MKPEAFSHAFQTWQRQSTRAFLMPLWIAVVLLIGYMFAQKPFENYLASHFTPHTVELIKVLPMISIGLAAFLTIFIQLRRIQWKLSIPSIHCNKSLEKYRSMVSASCPFCGKQPLRIERQPD